MERQIFLKKSKIITLCSLLFALCSLLFSCSRSNTDEKKPVTINTSAAWPEAVLQTGENPLWFQLTEDGPVLLSSIDDALLSAALIPWPLAMHVHTFYERDDEIVMAVNRDGFMKFAPYGEGKGRIAMYRFPGGLWKQYTVGGFVYYGDKPVVLLYLDERFLDSDLPPPPSRTWTFDMTAYNPFPITIPALESFPASDGWDVDALRLGSGSLVYYYRVSKRDAPQPEVRMLRTTNLSAVGEEITVEVFFNSASRKEEVTYGALPPLPEGFVYTGMGKVGGSIIAFWEEQSEYSIGAAGFVAIIIK
jgi:hypothetical protein